MQQITSLFLATPSVQTALSRLLVGPETLGTSSERALRALESLQETGAISDSDDLHVVKEMISQGRLQDARVCLGIFASQLSERRLNELSEAATAVLGVKLAHRALLVHRREPRLALPDYGSLPVLIEQIGEGTADALTAGAFLLTEPTAKAAFHYETGGSETNASSALHRIRFDGGAYFLDGLPLSHKQEAEAWGKHYRIRLPEGFVLEKTAEEIALQTKVSSLADLLRARGLISLTAEVEKLLNSSSRLDVLLRQIESEITTAGGLQEKMREMAILIAFQSLKSAYLPAAKDCEALSLFFGIANQIAQAESPAAILDLLSRAPLPRMLLMLSPIRDHARGYLPLSAVPEALGIRERMSELSAPPPPPPVQEPLVLRALRMSPKTFSEKPWRQIPVSERLRTELEPYRRFVAQKLDLEELFSQVRQDDEESNEPMDLASGHTEKAMYNRYTAEERDTAQTPSSGAGATGRLIQDLRHATVAGFTNGYWMYGGATPRRRFEARIYLSLNRRAAFAIWSHFIQVFEEGLGKRGVVTQYKMAVHREGLRRSDAGVVYFYGENQREIYDAVDQMALEHPEFLKEGRPLFTAPLLSSRGTVLKGVSFGEHPRMRGSSFGSLRTSALGAGVNLARLIISSGRSPDWEELLQIFALALNAFDVDIEDPAFNKGGGANLAFLKSKM